VLEPTTARNAAEEEAEVEQTVARRERGNEDRVVRRGEKRRIRRGFLLSCWGGTFAVVFT
jgi:hypothetical protein